MVAHRAIGMTNYDMLRDAIREDIVAGLFPPGSRLKVSDLTERYNISAIPIRDALQQLCGEGFVAIEPNRGASVREIDAKFLNQIYEIRRAVESYFVQRLAERVTRADITGLAAPCSATPLPCRGRITAWFTILTGSFTARLSPRPRTKRLCRSSRGTIR